MGNRVKVLRPGDVGFEEAAKGCLPPEVKRESLPRPIFTEYRKGRAVG